MILASLLSPRHFVSWTLVFSCCGSLLLAG